MPGSRVGTSFERSITSVAPGALGAGLEVTAPDEAEAASVSDVEALEAGAEALLLPLVVG